MKFYRDSKVQQRGKGWIEAWSPSYRRQKVDPHLRASFAGDLDDKNDQPGMSLNPASLTKEAKEWFAWLLEFYPELTRGCAVDRIRDGRAPPAAVGCTEIENQLSGI